jgi:two-component sensor histidine kinase
VQRQRELNVKSAIIQEVHHRVKNNLQSIAAVLRIQSRRCESGEARKQLTAAVNRILSMSVIHEYLSQDEHRPINIRDVCQRILGQAQQVTVNPGQHVKIAMEGPNIRLPASQATASALVVNELLMNAVEHGLRDRNYGEIRIALEDLGDEVRITLLDNGLGLPADFAPDQSRSLGLQIVHTLVTDDLKGELLFEQVTGDGTGATEGEHSGTRAIITFPKRSINVESVVA